MLDRRGLLKLLPVAATPICAERVLGKELAPVAAISATEIQPERHLMVFRLKQPLPEGTANRLYEQARSALDQLGFPDVQAIVVPFGVDVDVFSIPGGVPCSESAQSSSASSG